MKNMEGVEKEEENEKKIEGWRKKTDIDDGENVDIAEKDDQKNTHKKIEESSGNG